MTTLPEDIQIDNENERLYDEKGYDPNWIGPLTMELIHAGERASGRLHLMQSRKNPYTEPWPETQQRDGRF